MPHHGNAPQLTPEQRLAVFRPKLLDGDLAVAIELLETHADLAPGENCPFIRMVNILYVYHIMLVSYVDAKASPAHVGKRLALAGDFKHYERMNATRHLWHPFDTALMVFQERLNKLHDVPGLSLAVISQFEHSSL